MHGRGHEQKGNRPVILWRDLDHVKMAIVIPCTTTQECSKFPHTHMVVPSIKNCLSEDSIALIFQITSIDKKRLDRKLGELDAGDIMGIGAVLKEMLRV
ncbi:TPA: type II toxin-antitoxin system PemK/MazF family toxin [Candidatus Micrarchaeota archaeon]|nr:type II toxin-antitoxin system PemK/MazF family toxin [Candidatus Micrarchaeota archaeon]